MPYIKKGDRAYNRTARTAGELNYRLMCVLLKYLDEHGLSYQTLNDISGAMTECLAEFRRRVIVPYEETKIRDNGDLPEFKIDWEAV